MEKICQGCGAKINCQSDTTEPCSCKDLKLHPATLDLLERTFTDCLCNKCLLYLEELVLEALNQPAYGSGFTPQKGLHYYEENGFIVFTALYHVMRGYCCRSGCRHCPYGKESRFSDRRNPKT